MTGKTRPAAWTAAEQIAICSAYAVLLDAQNNELTVNKAELCRRTLPTLALRSRGAYEFKCCNISAALADVGLVYVTGYKPRSGYQRSLLDTLHKLRPDLVQCGVCEGCMALAHTDDRGTVCVNCRRSMVR